MARLYRIILPVGDIESAVVFYTHVLEEVGERVSPGRHYFNCEGMILACYDPVADGDELGDGWNPHVEQYIYFAVSDLQATVGRIESAGGTIVEGGIQEMPWGERMFWASDPFGNPISFVDDTTTFTGS